MHLYFASLITGSLCKTIIKEKVEKSRPIFASTKKCPSSHGISIKQPKKESVYSFTKESSVMDWLPLFSIANTSNSCSPGGRDATYSGETVTLNVVAGTVT